MAQEIITAVMGWNYWCAHTQCSLSHTLTSSSPWERSGFWLDSLHRRVAHLLPSCSLAPTFRRAGHEAQGWSITQTPPAPGEAEGNTSQLTAHTTLGSCRWKPEMFAPTLIFWGLKSCSSTIRFNDPRTTGLSAWVGTKLRG